MGDVRSVTVDNGSALWPPEGWWGLDGDDWPRTFEAWEKYRDEAERRRTVQRRESIRCTTWIAARPVRRNGQLLGAIRVPGRICGEVLTSMRAAPRHQVQAHPGQQCTFERIHLRWIWEMLGFTDYWDGHPVGTYNVGDGADARERAWEGDVLLLGGRVADHWWIDTAPADKVARM